MVYKGIAKGDKDYRHFTFDENDFTLKGGVYYYKVNYGKSKLEGPDAEDEIGFVPCNQIMFLGGKKPKNIPGAMQIPSPVQVETDTASDNQSLVKQVQKRGRPKKVQSEKTDDSVYPISYDAGLVQFEYHMCEFSAGDINDMESKLNELGQAGWELCGFDSFKSLFGSVQMTVVFKRKRG